MNPLVSIIIPTYNRANLICETLDSVLAQTYTNWECIIVDDGSTDTTHDVVNKYILKDSRFQYYQRPKDRPQGGNAARNYGFEKSKGTYVNWFDDDDLMHRSFLEIKLKQFDCNYDFVLTLGCFKNKNDLKNEIQVKDCQTGNLFKGFLMWKLKIFTPTIMFDRNFLINKKLFSASIIRGQETEFFSRIFFQASDYSFKTIKAPLFYYREHEETKSNQSKKYNSNFKSSQAKIFIKNLNRSIFFGDKELIKHCLTLVIDLFFSVIKKKDPFLAKYILKELYLVSRRFSYWKSIYIFVLGRLIICLGSIRFRIKKIFKNSLKFIFS